MRLEEVEGDAEFTVTNASGAVVEGTTAWTALAQEGFTSNRWTRTYKIAARKGVDYLFATSNLVDDCDLTLAVRAFKRNGTYDTALQAAVWSGEADGNGVYTLKANENAEYFIEVSVAEGLGLDYPAFDLRHKASAEEGLGILKVVTKGAEGTWTVNNEYTPKYSNGDSILVAGDEAAEIIVGSGVDSDTNIIYSDEVIRLVKGVAFSMALDSTNGTVNAYSVSVSTNLMSSWAVDGLAFIPDGLNVDVNGNTVSVSSNPCG